MCMSVTQLILHIIHHRIHTFTMFAWTRTVRRTYKRLALAKHSKESEIFSGKHQFLCSCECPLSLPLPSLLRMM